jgi:PAS domain S-box-containing protein
MAAPVGSAVARTRRYLELKSVSGDTGCRRLPWCGPVVLQFLPDTLPHGLVAHGTHGVPFVVLSALIAFLATGGAFAVVDRMRAAPDAAVRRRWLAVGSLAMGTGIWAMHFVGMLSWRLPVPVAYDAIITLVSITPAILAGAVALHVIAEPRVSRGRLVAGGTLMGLGIGAMHFLGMSAVRVNGVLYHRADLVAVSVVAAVVLAIASLHLRAVLHYSGYRSSVLRWICAALLAAAIVAMHYTAMRSAVVLIGGSTPYPAGILPASAMASLVTLAVAFVVGTTVVGTLLDRRFTDLSTHLVSREAGIDAVLRTLAEGVITFDATGVIESANPAAERMFGAAADGLVGQRVESLIPTVFPGALPALALTQREAGRSVPRRELEGRRVNGQPFPLELAVAEIPLAGRTLFSGVVRDITERVASEASLHEHVRQLETARNALQEQAAQLAVARDRAEAGARAKSEFLATMSHELRTPMNGVLGMAQLLLHTPLSDEQAARVHALRKSGEALLRIINDVLDFSRMEAGKLTIDAQPFDLCQLLEDVRETLATAADVVGLSLEVDVSPHCPRHVMGDEGRVRQVLFNLVGNAIKFTDRGRVVIRAEASEAPGDSAIRLHVTDTGIGMSPETLARLFAPFTQGDGSTTRRHGGSGLGLSISKGLVELMGGSLAVTSTVGSGTHFIATLPLPAAAAQAPVPHGQGHDAAAIAAGAATRSRHEPRGVRVLVAEDNMINQVVAVSLLAHLGCTVDVAADGVEAVRRWSEGAFDLILMDCQMPEMDGLEATRRIRAAEAGDGRIPIVALTANAMREDREACLAAGMDDHIAKPVTEESLLAAIALARRSTDSVAA